MALLPTVMVQDELRDGVLVACAVVPQLYETFCGITVQRHVEPPLLRSLFKRPQQQAPAPPPARSA